MISSIHEYLELIPLLEAQQGVLLHSDLEVFWEGGSAQTLQNRINLFASEGVLRKVCRGVYVGRSFNPWMLASRMYPDCVISTVSVLAKSAFVGTAPTEQVWCTRIGKSRDHFSKGIAVHAWSLDPFLMTFGIEFQGAIRVATPEKAFLDTLHFHMHGRTYPFSIPNDIDLDRLDHERIEEYLLHYKNRRFRTFANGILHGTK